METIVYRWLKVLLVNAAYFAPVFLILGIARIFLGPSLFWVLILISYFILIIPIFFIAIVNMADYKNKSGLSSPFKLREIFKKISIIGWGNLIKWYIVTGILALIIYIIIGIIEFFIDGIIFPLGETIWYLIINTYLVVFIIRSSITLYIR